MKLDNVKVGETLRSNDNHLFHYLVLEKKTWHGEELLYLRGISDDKKDYVWGELVVVNDVASNLYRREV